MLVTAASGATRRLAEGLAESRRDALALASLGCRLGRMKAARSTDMELAGYAYNRR
jgi:hypothetical protein